MRISELSRVSCVPTATIKYYLREKLLHDGLRTSPTQAQYDDTHVAPRAIEPIGRTAHEFVLVRSLIGRSRHEVLGRWPLH